MNPFDLNLDRSAANYVPLSPLSFLPRTAATFPQSRAVVHGSASYTWAEAYDRCRRLASALAGLGVGLWKDVDTGEKAPPDAFPNAGPPGVATGQYMTLRGVGNVGPRGGPRGDVRMERGAGLVEQRRDDAVAEHVVEHGHHHAFRICRIHHTDKDT